MTSDWALLRQHLQREIAEQIGRLIKHDPDLHLRAYLARHRHAIVERLVDQVELAYLRRIVADHHDDQPLDEPAAEVEPGEAKVMHLRPVS